MRRAIVYIIAVLVGVPASFVAGAAVFADGAHILSAERIAPVAVTYLALGAILLLAPFYFIDALGFSATRMGFFITAYTLARTFLAPFSG